MPLICSLLQRIQLEVEMYTFIQYDVWQFFLLLKLQTNTFGQPFQDSENSSTSEALTAKLRLEVASPSSKLRLEPTSLASKLPFEPTSQASKLRFESTSAASKLRMEVTSPASKLRLEPTSPASKLLLEPTAVAVSVHTPTSPRSLPRPPSAPNHFDFRRGGIYFDNITLKDTNRFKLIFTSTRTKQGFGCLVVFHVYKFEHSYWKY